MNINQPVEVNWAHILDLNRNSAILFRVDASAQIGSGHVMRCLTLAGEIRDNCNKIVFCCRELPGNMIGFIEERGYPAYHLPADGKSNEVDETKRILQKNNFNPDWLIIDHYELDRGWERHLRPLVKRIMVIDDLANREHDCDLLLDQNYYRNPETRYRGLIPENSQQLLGPKYVLLRREFKAVRQNLRVRDGLVRRILVCFGGSDPTNETVKALEAIKLLNHPEIAVDVVVGATNHNQERIRQLCSLLPNTSFYCQIDNMPEMMARADLAIGAGGTATWERCYLGLPSLVTIIADNQRETIEALAETGAVWNLGWHKSVTAEKIAETLKNMIERPDRLRDLSRKSIAIFE